MTRDEKWLLDEKYDGKETPEYEADKMRLARGEPLAYVIGWQPFLGLKIYLDSHPLIPRPETEWWTEQLLQTVSNQFRTRRVLNFLDLCAGSGAIGCAALAKLPNAHVFFGEIDPVHQATIQRNVDFVSPHFDTSHIRIGDLFEPFDSMKFDIIAANPPYVPAGRVLPASVALYEPALALLAGEDGLDIIRRITMELPNRLKKGGVAWIECDRGHAEAARALFEEQGFKALIRTDQYDKPRVIVVSFP